MSGDGICAYSGEFLISPAGLELSMNWCGHDCSYCFANLNKPNRRADLASIMGLLANFRSRQTREARLMQAGVPLLVSNHVDVFAGTNAEQFEPIWEVCVEQGVPLAWQTRGAHKPQRKILDRVIRETPRSVWYVSVPFLSDEVRQRLEPRAPSISSRLELIEQLIEAGHVVTVGVNPCSLEWLPEYEPLLDRLKELGVWGVWIQVPYFGKSFRGNLSRNARERLGENFIRDCGEYGSKLDIAHARSAMEYAIGIGLEVFSTEYESPTGFFDPWHEVYDRVMPYWHELINAVDSEMENGVPYAVITREMAQEAMSPLPNLDWSNPLLHKRARQYRKIVQPLPGGKLPKQDADGFWRIMWNDDIFSKSIGPLSFRRMAYASVIENGIITPLLDENGEKLVVYRRKGWKNFYAHTPELA
jgi:DNA repair photolyase